MDHDVTLCRGNSRTFRAAPMCHDFRSTLRTIFTLTTGRHVTFIVSRCPCLTGTSQAVGSILRRTVSHRGSSDRLVVILYNSSVSFVRHRILKCRDPLCNEHATRVGIRPFNCTSIHGFLPECDGRSTTVTCKLASNVPRCLQRLSSNVDVQSGVH